MQKAIPPLNEYTSNSSNGRQFGLQNPVKFKVKKAFVVYQGEILGSIGISIDVALDTQKQV